MWFDLDDSPRLPRAFYRQVFSLLIRRMDDVTRVYEAAYFVGDSADAMSGCQQMPISDDDGAAAADLRLPRSFPARRPLASDDALSRRRAARRVETSALIGERIG